MLHFAAINDVKPQIERFKFSDVNEVFKKVKGNEVRFRAVLFHE